MTPPPPPILAQHLPNYPAPPPPPHTPVSNPFPPLSRRLLRPLLVPDTFLQTRCPHRRILTFVFFFHRRPTRLCVDDLTCLLLWEVGLWGGEGISRLAPAAAWTDNEHFRPAPCGAEPMFKGPLLLVPFSFYHYALFSVIFLHPPEGGRRQKQKVR